MHHPFVDGCEQWLQIRINFNVTMLDLPCRFAVVDVLDVLGTNRMNVSKNIEKVGEQKVSYQSLAVHSNTAKPRREAQRGATQRTVPHCISFPCTL